MDVLNGYRDSHAVSSDDDSEDSDKECTVWKRATVRKACTDETPVEEVEIKEPPAPAPEPVMVNPKRKRNTVWSEVLQDQLISEDFEDCLLKNKPRNYGSRGKESYDYTLKYADARSESDSHMSDSGLSEASSKSKVRHTSSFHANVKKFVKLTSAELGAARKINKVLNEKKYYLIQRIVKIVGIEKAMALLSMTQEIEDNGGMMIHSNTRRRTPGGVYIQLLKSDASVTKEMLDKIFEGEMSGIELKKFYAEQKKNRRKKKKKQVQKKGADRQTHHNDSNEMSEMSDVQDPSEVVPMDAEIIADTNCKKSNSEDTPAPVPTFDRSSPRNISDLEEGEIED